MTSPAANEAITGNIGEWSELYTLIKLLADGYLQSGDGDLVASQLAPLPVLTAFRTHAEFETSYTIRESEISVVGAAGQSELSRADCENWAKQLLIELAAVAKTKGSRSIPEAKKWMQALQTTQLKAQSKDKSDLHLVLHDIKTGVAPKLGFSVKSQLGAASTLFNANGDNTNALFSVENIVSSDIAAFNTEKFFRKKFAGLPKNYKLRFENYSKSLFAINLRSVDGELPVILAHLTRFYYEGVSDSKTTDLCECLERLNPLSIDLKVHPAYYSLKIKRFLVDAALGFTPAKPWMGRYDATGGYIVVKKTGELLSYHIYNRNQFEDYLFKTTALETPSTSRHDYGTIFEENGKFKLKLNLQIRFFH